MKKLVLVELVRVELLEVRLIILRLAKLLRVVVAITPFTVEVKIPVVVAKVLELVVEEVIAESNTCFNSPVT